MRAQGAPREAGPQAPLGRRLSPHGVAHRRSDPRPDAAARRPSPTAR
jgi:hypothetical protein